jgi:hypothetical protein
VTPLEPGAQLDAQGASPEEAAAVVAAIARFARDTAPIAQPPRAHENGWLRAGRLEAVGAEPDELGTWGDGHPWGESLAGLAANI